MRHHDAAPFLLAAGLLALPVGHARLAAQAPTQVVAKATPDTVDAAPDSTVRDSAEVTAVARRHAGTVRHCYNEQGLKLDPALRGLLRVELVVLPTGIVQAATATATAVNGTGMDAVRACVSNAARAWRFGDEAPRTARVVLEFDLLPPSP